MKQLKEKVAIVTGAGQGIGKGIALCLAKRGVKVIATGRRAEPIEQTIAEIKELDKGKMCQFIFNNNYKDIFEMCYINIFNPDRKSTRLNSSHREKSRMPSSA